MSLTEKEAYLAMFYFLQDMYFQTHSDELGMLLGSMSLLRDGGPADPAAWSDWQKAIEKVKLVGESQAYLVFKRNE